MVIKDYEVIDVNDFKINVEEIFLLFSLLFNIEISIHEIYQGQFSFVCIIRENLLKVD